MSLLSLSLIFVLCISALLIFFGVLISVYDRFEYISAYEKADLEERKKFDIRGLADHVGNGLITLGILMIIALLFVYLRHLTWAMVFASLSVFIGLIIIIGAPKFMNPEIKHPFLYRLLSKEMYESLKRKTEAWLMVCNTCGEKSDYWNHGGIRHGVGEPTQLQYCEKCKKFRMHKVRKKSEAEKSEVK